MNKRVVVSVLIVVLLALCTFAVVYGQNLYRMFLRHIGAG